MLGLLGAISMPSSVYSAATASASPAANAAWMRSSMAAIFSRSGDGALAGAAAGGGGAAASAAPEASTMRPTRPRRPMRPAALLFRMRVVMVCLGLLGVFGSTELDFGFEVAA